MPQETYLVLIREGRLALAVATALEERLARDGHETVALVPAARHPGHACPQGRGWPSWLASLAGPGRPPLVVALREEGLLPWLQAIGAAAYVGVPREQEWQVVRWGKDSGAIMLPVATARDLVEAVARHTPWAVHAGKFPAPVKAPGRHPASLPPPHPALLSRGLAKAGAAGMAGSLLLLGAQPAVATAADGHAAGTVIPAAASKITLDAYRGPAMPVPPVPPRKPGPPGPGIDVPAVVHKAGQVAGNIEHQFESRAGAGLDTGKSWGGAGALIGGAIDGIAGGLSQLSSGDIEKVKQETGKQAQIGAAIGGIIGGVIGFGAGFITANVPWDSSQGTTGTGGAAVLHPAGGTSDGAVTVLHPAAGPSAGGPTSASGGPSSSSAVSASSG